MSQLGVPLRPLGLGDLFDGAIRIFRERFGLLFGLSVLAFAPIAVIGVALQALGNELARRAGDAFEAADLARVLVPALASVPLYFVAFDVSFGAQVHAISQARFGRRATMGQGFRHALKHFWSLLGTQLLYLVAITLMMITVIGIPFAIYFAVVWAFAFHAVLLEDAGVFRAFGRSRELVRGHWWRTLGIALLFLLFIWVVSIVLLVPLGALVGFVTLTQGPEGLQSPLYIVGSTVLNLLGSAITTPLTYCAWVLYYYDLRIRKEVLDLELRARELASAPPVAG
ncbi:MAG TPA: glycerophosphoryl diester phosphodiesterase membrane domain-containing protein [Chloroflexota bacterium]|jgi:hypothetical protein|nr:glycerophosphoryl diester phosphodiesterase membrane domain-containing protein [Chloroflexota bacterium]